MSLVLPQPSKTYDVANEAQNRASIQAADKLNRKTNADVEIGPNKLILTSPDGTRWNATVSNAGAWVITAL